MIGIDTNILVFSHRAESPHCRAARNLLQSLAEGSEPWMIPWPCIYEFLRVVTHPRVFTPASTVQQAFGHLEPLFGSPSLCWGSEGPEHLPALRSTLQIVRPAGNLVHAAHIATLLIEHGVREFLTDDRDFARFPGLKITHPFG
jgi:uncharacterized protein